MIKEVEGQRKLPLLLHLSQVFRRLLSNIVWSWAYLYVWLHRRIIPKPEKRIHRLLDSLTPGLLDQHIHLLLHAMSGGRFQTADNWKQIRSINEGKSLTLIPHTILTAPHLTMNLVACKKQKLD